MGDDGTVNLVITADDKASKVFAAVENAVQSITSTVSKLTGRYVAYGDKVAELAKFTGMSNAEASKTIQVFDDAFVSYETLIGAARAMTQENMQNAGQAAKLKEEIAKLNKEMSDGKSTQAMRDKMADLQKQLKETSPTANLNIDSLARLSDQYNKLQSPVEKSNFLMENFKRSGIDLAKIMELGGAKIREMSAGISDSLIIDDQKAEKIKKTKQALDDFNDRLEGIKFDAAQKLLDVFDSLPTPIKDAVQVLGMVGGSGLLGQLANLSILAGNLSKFDIAGWFSNVSAKAWSAAPAIWATAGPIVAVTAAVASLVELFRMDETKQALALLWGGIGTAVTGDKLRGAAATATAYKNMGGGQKSLTNDTETGAMIRNLFSGSRASGGPVRAGEAYMVGENGPEPFIPDTNGYILPAGSRGGVVNLSVHIHAAVNTADEMAVVQALTPILPLALRSASGTS